MVNNNVKGSSPTRKKGGGAKKVLFSTDKKGEVCVTTGSADLHGIGAIKSDIEYGHGYIKIAQSVLDDAVKRYYMTKHLGAGGKNVFYICKPNRFLHFYSNRVLLQCDPLSILYGAFQVMDNTKYNLKLLDKKNVYLVNSQGEKLTEGRHISKVTINGITMQAALALKWENKKVASIEKVEAHHENASWDMRDESIKALTKAQHDQVHHLTSAQSHTMIVKITTLKELIAFMNWLETDDYKNLFK